MNIAVNYIEESFSNNTMRDFCPDCGSVASLIGFSFCGVYSFPVFYCPHCGGNVWTHIEYRQVRLDVH